MVVVVGGGGDDNDGGDGGGVNCGGVIAFVTGKAMKIYATRMNL